MVGVASCWEWIRDNVIGDALPTFMVCTQTTVLCWRWITRLELVSMQLLVEGKDHQPSHNVTTALRPVTCAPLLP